MLSISSKFSSAAKLQQMRGFCMLAMSDKLYLYIDIEIDLGPAESFSRSGLLFLLANATFLKGTIQDQKKHSSGIRISV